MPVKTNREYRTISLLNPTQSNKRINSDYYVEGYAARYEPYLLAEIGDRKIYEQIDRNALSGADLSDVIMQYNHQGRVLARQSNDSLVVEANDEGLFMAADLGSTDASKEMFSEISQGLVTKMSWAFTIDDAEFDRDTDTRVIKRINKVYDVSAVSVPANGDTNISARSFAEGVIEQEMQELQERKRKVLRIKSKLLKENL